MKIAVCVPCAREDKADAVLLTVAVQFWELQTFCSAISAKIRAVQIFPFALSMGVFGVRAWTQVLKLH